MAIWIYSVLFVKDKSKTAVGPKPVINDGNLDLVLTAIHKDYVFYVMQEIRLIINCNLFQAKRIIKNMPFRLLSGIDNDSAQEIKKRLERWGCSVNITDKEY